MLLQAAVRHEAAVAGQDLGLRQVRDRPILIRVSEDELARFQRCARTRRGFLTRALHHRLRQPVAETEVVVGVVERRRRVQVEERQAADAVGAGEQLVVVVDGYPRLLVVAGEQDRDCVHIVAREAAHPVVRVIRARVSENIGARRHPFAELVGKTGQGLLGYAERAQPGPRERQRDPPSAFVHGFGCVGCGLHEVEQFRQPRSATGLCVERQKLIPPRDRGRSGQKDVLNVVEFEHPCRPRATASGRACPRRRPSGAAPS